MSELKFNNLKVDYKLDIDYTKLFGTWYKPLSEFLEGDYMYNLMVFLQEAYKIKNIVPNKNQVFNVFNKLPYENVRVVIIGEEPYHDTSNTGIAYAQKEALVVNDEIAEIEECVERSAYDGFKLHMDYTLENWVKQGVLPLYSSLTSEFKNKGSHTFIWRDFIRNLIININDYKLGTIFMLWGKNAHYFEQYINKDNHYIFKSKGVSEALENGQMWHTEAFKETNEILKLNNGKEFIINW